MTNTSATVPAQSRHDSMEGLSESEAARRSRAGEGNRLRAHAGRSYAAIIWQSTFVPVNLVLFAVAAALVVLGLPIDAALTGLPVLANMVVSAAWKSPPSGGSADCRSCRRPGRPLSGRHERSIHTRRWSGVTCCGRPGDQIVLDGELVDGELEVDELLLTGEADPVVRRRGQALMSGSVCVSGSAIMRVTHVGLESYANQLTAQVQSMRTERTPLQRGVDRLIAMTTVLVVMVSLAVARLILRRNRRWQSPGCCRPRRTRAPGSRS